MRPQSASERSRSGSARTTSIGFELASSLTLVGLTRVSIGPAISVMLRGCAGCCDCAITAAATRTATQGWHTATIWAPGPIVSQEVDEMLDIFVETEPAMRRGDVADVVPIGDVDVMLGQHGAHRGAQQRREMSRQRRDQQHARLRHVDVLLEMEERPERRDEARLLAHRHFAVADRHRAQCRRAAGGGSASRARSVRRPPRFFAALNRCRRHYGTPCMWAARAANVRTGTMKSE